MSDSEEEITERQFKVALVGDTQVGKTSIATRYASGKQRRFIHITSFSSTSYYSNVS